MQPVWQMGPLGLLQAYPIRLEVNLLFFVVLFSRPLTSRNRTLLLLVSLNTGPSRLSCLPSLVSLFSPSFDGFQQRVPSTLFRPISVFPASSKFSCSICSCEVERISNAAGVADGSAWTAPGLPDPP